MPSVRGRERLSVISLVITAGTVAGASAGLIAAALAAPLAVNMPNGVSTAMLVVAIISCGLLLDAVALKTGQPTPPASGRQVPQEWSRLLTPPVVAVLYGARLGVGPLTILSTWTWWSVTVAAALAGPWTSVGVGASFGFVRLLTTVGISLLTEPHRTEHARWFGTLRRVQRPNWIAINGIGLVAVSMLLLVGCGAGDDPEQTTRDVSDAAEQAAVTLPQSLEDSEADPRDDSATPDHGNRTSGQAPVQQLITPVELEDVVRTALEKQLTGTPGQAASSDPAGGPEPTTVEATTNGAGGSVVELVSSDPESLSQVLMAEIGGFEPVDDPMADRYLDIIAASQIQPDPTEEIALLETRGYEGGWTRAFRNDSNDVAVTSVYHFKDAAEAEFYLEDGLITIGGYGGKFFDIESLPGVRGFVQYFTETDDGGSEELVSLGAAFQEGPRWFLVYFVGSVETVTPEVLIPAITAQR